MYDSGPSQKELDAIGLRLEDVTDTSDFEIWPENWTTFLVFSEVSTQWRMGPGGPTGLDYGIVKWVMKLMHIKKPLPLLHDLRIMESAALKQMSKA